MSKAIITIETDGQGTASIQIQAEDLNCEAAIMAAEMVECYVSEDPIEKETKSFNC